MEEGGAEINKVCFLLCTLIRKITWGAITVKNGCLTVVSTVPVVTLRCAVVLFQCDVLMCCLVLVSWHCVVTFDCFAFAMC